MAAGPAPSTGEGPTPVQNGELKCSVPKAQLAGPCPTGWTARDDLLLMKSMEAGYALEALARGAMALSRRFSLGELEERWRALLLDKDTAEDSARRMLTACGQALVLGDLSAVPSLPSKRREGSPSSTLRPHYARARKRARQDALERRRRLLLDPTFGALYADDDDDLSVGLADPGMPTPQDMNSLAGMEEPLLAHLKALEERIHDNRGRSGGGKGGSRGWEAEMEEEAVPRVRKRKELLGYHHAKHMRNGDALAPGGAREGVGYDLLVVRHEAEGQEAEGGRMGDAHADGNTTGVERGLGVQLWSADGGEAEMGAGGTAGGGIEHDMLQEMFSVLTGDMGDDGALESPGAQEVEQPRAREGLLLEEQASDPMGEAAPVEMRGEGPTPATPGDDGVPLRRSPGAEVAHSSGERSGPELSFGVSDGGVAMDKDVNGVHASSTDGQQAGEGGSGDAHGGDAAAKEGEVEGEGEGEGEAEEKEAPPTAGHSADRPSPAAPAHAGEASASNLVPSAGFQLAPPQRSSPWSTPRLGPQAAPPDPDLMQDLDGLVSWSLSEKKPAAPSPLFHFARGTGPSPTFTPLPGADATDALDFLPLPSAALPAPPGTQAQRHLMGGGGEMPRPSSSPALAPHARHAHPRLADQMHLMEEDTRSEPGDIARFRDRHLMRSASLDGAQANRVGGGRKATEGGAEGHRKREGADNTGGEAARKAGPEEDEAHINSEEESLCFSDVEAVVLDLDLEPDDETGDAARRRARRLQSKYRRAMLRLEQMADSATGRQLTRERALAVLYGRRLRYLIRDSEILVGRSTVGQSVDVDLAREGPATKVSRKQASIKLKKDGNWYIKNLGKRELQVNNRPVEAGSREKLDNKCLLEIGGLRLVFEINSKLVAKVLSRMPPDL